MPELEVLTRQPDFPKEDLTDTNAAMIEYLLKHEQSNRPYADVLRESLRAIHLTGHNALRILGVNVDYSQAEYAAFCEGFAALEYTSTLVRPRVYSGDIAVMKTKNLLVNNEDMVEFELADRRAAWQESHPNTHGVIINDGAERGETMKQLHARGMGAELAWELQVR